MKIKLHGNDILCTDIKPNIKIAEFNDEVIPLEKKYLVLNANFGQEFINLYQRYRSNMHIANMVGMLEEMELLYEKYDYEKITIRRKNE